MYENTRGIASRSLDKQMRTGSHVNVVKECFARLKPDTVIEHGMGNSSTVLFHELGVHDLLSFEDDDKWKKCAANCDGSHHVIERWSLDKLQEFIDGYKNVLGFVDGIGRQRIPTLECMLRNGIREVIEHDAESWDKDELLKRTELCKEFGYHVYQYVLENPETALYSKEELKLEGYIIVV